MGSDALSKEHVVWVGSVPSGGYQSGCETCDWRGEKGLHVEDARAEGLKHEADAKEPTTVFYVRDDEMLGPMNTVAVRPATAADITPEMVERALDEFWREGRTDHEAMRDALEAVFRGD